MLKDNLIMLRKLKDLSQEEVAEKIGISRQAYGKWESGETIPDIEKCAALAKIYDVTIDSLIREYEVVGIPIAPAPKGKHIFGTVTMNERGQILIPKDARDVFCLESGTKFIVLGDEEEGLALIKESLFTEKIHKTMDFAAKKSDESI